MKYLSISKAKDVLSKKIFVENGQDAIKCDIYKKTLNMIKHILNVKSTKERLTTDDSESGSALKALNGKFDEPITKCFVNDLHLTEARLYEHDIWFKC